MNPPNSMLVDADGNSLVGLSFWHGDPMDSHATIKFDPNGNQLWEIGHLEGSEFRLTGARILDPYDNFYLAMIRPFEQKLIVTKYGPDGKQLWSVEQASPDQWFNYQNGALHIGPDQQLTFAGFGGKQEPSTLNFATFLQNTTDSRPIIHGKQPGLRRVASLTTVHFDVTATGLAPLHYQWRRDGVNLPGATNATLTLTNVRVSDSGGYSVLITNPAGCSVSTEGLLVVVDVPPFRLVQVRATNDLLAFTLTGEPGRLYWIEASTNLVDWTLLYGYGGGPAGVLKFGSPWRFVRAYTSP